MAIKMRAYFTIYGDNFNPDDITSELKLSPTYTWRKGDQIEKSLLLYKDDGWCIKTKKKYVMNYLLHYLIYCKY